MAICIERQTECGRVVGLNNKLDAHIERASITEDKTGHGRLMIIPKHGDRKKYRCPTTRQREVAV